MTTTTDIGAAAPARVLSARTRAAYASDWALFTDHCAVTASRRCPRTRDTVVDFLDRCPAAPATRRRRVAAIDHHHTAAGLHDRGSPPRCGPRSAGPPATPFHPTERDRAGSTRRCAGCPRTAGPTGCSAAGTAACWCSPNWRGCRTGTWPRLTAGDISLADGVATIRSPAGEWTVRPADDGLLCGPCAVIRWLKILDLAVTKPSTKTIAGPLKTRAGGGSPVDRTSADTAPVLGDGDPGGAAAAADRPMGRPTVPAANACPRTRCPAGPGTSSPGTSARTATCPSTPTRNRRRPHRKADRRSRRRELPTERRHAAAAWDRRRHDLRDLAGIIDVLTDVERRADELNRRATELADEWL